MNWAKTLIADYFGTRDSVSSDESPTIVNKEELPNVNTAECSQCKTIVNTDNCYHIHSAGVISYECKDDISCRGRKVENYNKVMAESRKHLSELGARYEGMSKREQFNKKFKGVNYENITKKFSNRTYNRSTDSNVKRYTFYADNSNKDVFVWCVADRVWLDMNEAINEYPHLSDMKRLYRDGSRDSMRYLTRMCSALY